jgi:nuclear pore complex protein Nup205
MVEADFVPTISTRYLQILTPALSLCDAIISSLGVQNESAILQVFSTWVSKTLIEWQLHDFQ